MEEGQVRVYPVTIDDLPISSSNKVIGYANALLKEHKLAIVSLGVHRSLCDFTYKISYTVQDESHPQMIKLTTGGLEVDDTMSTEDIVKTLVATIRLSR